MRYWFKTREIVVPSSETQVIGYTLYLAPLIQVLILGSANDRRVANLADIRRCADKQWKAYEKSLKEKK